MGRVLKRVGRIVPAEVLGATQQAAAIREQARADGYGAGRAAAAAELTTLLVAAAAEAERLRVAVVPSAQRLATEMAAAMATKIAAKIVGRAVELSPSLIADLAEQALVASRARGGVVKLRIHPDDLEALRSDDVRRRLVARIGAGGELRFVPDASVGRFGCVVETSVGRLDARLESQLRTLERVLLGQEPHG
jgi:flagellar assembly protein FliH